MGNQYIFRWLPSNPSDEAWTFASEAPDSADPAVCINDIIRSMLSNRQWAGRVQVMGVMEEDILVGNITSNVSPYSSYRQRTVGVFSTSSVTSYASWDDITSAPQAS